MLSGQKQSDCYLLYTTVYSLYFLSLVKKTNYSCLFHIFSLEHIHFLHIHYYTLLLQRVKYLTGENIRSSSYQLSNLKTRNIKYKYTRFSSVLNCFLGSLEPSLINPWMTDRQFLSLSPAAAVVVCSFDKLDIIKHFS